jgi:hypothetical protein
LDKIRRLARRGWLQPPELSHRLLTAGSGKQRWLLNERGMAAARHVGSAITFLRPVVSGGEWDIRILFQWVGGGARPRERYSIQFVPEED